MNSKVKQLKGKRQEYLKETMTLGIDLIDHFTEMILIVGEVIMIGFDDKEPAEVICFNPGLISFVQPFQIIYSD